MAINFPVTSLDTTTQLPTESASTPLSTNHVVAHTNLALGIIALETKVGINSSAVTTTVDYKLSGIPATDKAVSLTGNETLTTKTLGTNTKITLGSDATGDIYYRHSDGTLKRLAIGTSNYILNVNGGVPAWRAETAVVTGDYTNLGILKGLTDEATSHLTISSGVISVKTGTSAGNVVALDGSAKLPAVDGSALTGTKIFNNGVTTYDTSTASGTQNIAHGLGAVPKKVKITSSWVYRKGAGGVGTSRLESIGAYNGTTMSTLYWYEDGSGYPVAATSNSIIIIYSDSGGNIASATVTVDATNIILTWTKTSSPTATLQIMWEAEW